MIARSSLNLQSRSSLLRWAILGFSLAPVVGAFAYAQGFRLTIVHCLFQAWFGFPSPGCGLTRSLTALAKGDWQQAVMYHAFGPVIFSMFVLAAAHVTIELISRRSLSTPYTRLLRQPSFLVIMAVLFLGYYALRLYARYSEGMLPWGWSEAIVWQNLVAGAKAL